MEEVGHLLGQRDDDDLLGQGHGADDDGEQDAPADEALLAQGVARQGGGETGQDHSRRRNEDDVEQPQEGGVVKQPGVVFHRGFDGEPDGRPGRDLQLVLEGAGDDPVQREQEEDHHDHQDGHGENLIPLGGAAQISFCIHVRTPLSQSSPL